MFVSFVQTAIEIWKLYSGATQRELLVLHIGGMHKRFKCDKYHPWLVPVPVPEIYVFYVGIILYIKQECKPQTFVMSVIITQTY
jgi:hypothetical protein